MPDEILDEIARVRAELLETYGGFEGYFQHLQELDKARIEHQKKQSTARRKRLLSAKPKSPVKRARKA